VTAERLRALVVYNRTTGVFTWRAPAGRWGRIPAGAVAGGMNGNGYWRLYVDGHHYDAQVLAWLYVKGEWPPGHMDHRNTKRGDNRWRNLRLATRQQNRANTRANRNNRTGVKGAVPVGARFAAYIKVDHKSHYLGMFDTPSEAGAAYLKAATSNFGGYARGA
jgi:hypothetical protein